MKELKTVAFHLHKWKVVWLLSSSKSRGENKLEIRKFSPHGALFTVRCFFPLKMFKTKVLKDLYD